MVRSASLVYSTYNHITYTKDTHLRVDLFIQILEHAFHNQSKWYKRVTTVCGTLSNLCYVGRHFIMFQLFARCTHIVISYIPYIGLITCKSLNA